MTLKKRYPAYPAYTCASDIFDGMIKKNKLVNQPGLNEKIKILAAKDEIKTVATKAELIAEQVQIKISNG